MIPLFTMHPRQSTPLPFVNAPCQWDLDFDVTTLRLKADGGVLAEMRVMLSDKAPVLPPDEFIAAALDAFLARIHHAVACAQGDRPDPASDTSAPPTPGADTAGR